MRTALMAAMAACFLTLFASVDANAHGYSRARIAELERRVDSQVGRLETMIRKQATRIDCLTVIIQIQNQTGAVIDPTRCDPDRMRNSGMQLLQPDLFEPTSTVHRLVFNGEVVAPNQAQQAFLRGLSPSAAKALEVRVEIGGQALAGRRAGVIKDRLAHHGVPLDKMTVKERADLDPDTIEIIVVTPPARTREEDR